MDVQVDKFPSRERRTSYGFPHLLNDVSATTSSRIRFPPLSKYRQQSLSSPVGGRRRSEPVYALGTPKRHSARPDDPSSDHRRLLRESKSYDQFLSHRKNSTSSWRVSLLVGKAVRSFTKGKGQGQGTEKALSRKLSFTDIAKIVSMRRPDSEKRRMIKMKKLKAEKEKKVLQAKFRMAAKLAIFCRRNFTQHCLRINSEEDELAPFIKQLHFHEDETPDLLIDLTKFKANRQMRIPEETKRILSKEVGERTKQELYSVQIALRNIKCFAEYPNRMQEKIAEVGLYETYESKRVIVRQGHPASAFYFILSGGVVVMVMDMESRYARPVAHLYKGQTFGELAIINGTERNSTVIAKETCEFLSISVQDYHKIFMSGGVKNLSDPDQEIFLRSLSCLTDWPIHILPEHPTKCQFLFFKRDDVLTKDSRYSDWLFVVKSGSIEVLKKLKKVGAFEWKTKKKLPEVVSGSSRRDYLFKRSEWRRILPELRIPLKTDTSVEDITQLTSGRPVPFLHPDGEERPIKPIQNKVPNLWPFSANLSEVEYGSFLEEDYFHLPDMRFVKSQTIAGTREKTVKQDIPEKPLQKKSSLLGLPKKRDRSKSIIEEEEKEMLGFQPHIRTIMEDLKNPNEQTPSEENEELETNPEFVHVQTLTKGQVFGLADLIMGEQPSFAVVSRGADCILINKQFYMDNAPEKLIRDMRQELCPYPTEEALQEGLQVKVDWGEYRRDILRNTLESVALRREMRAARHGTKVQEAFS